MKYQIPLPNRIQEKYHFLTHPGLALDKYVHSWVPTVNSEQPEISKFSESVQKPAIEKVVELSHSEPNGLQFHSVRKKWANLMATVGALRFKCITTSPLTLHLSRASALENAGLCLHQQYGFAYLPGSGLKGMARAYAVTIWKPAQKDERTADSLIEKVFGNAPAAKSQFSGSVVFHDAWPMNWPKLRADIVNNHHPGYYSGNNPPGDWENPIPVYFLSIEAGSEYVFHLSLRRNDDDANVLNTSKEWLIGALCHLGAGAKTNAGYGCFKTKSEDEPTAPQPVMAIFSTTIELVTPGFLAGSSPRKPSDCDLRSATLRGLLRWWWRTMHAGNVDINTLRSMEAAIWGDTDKAGAIRISVTPDIGNPLPELYNIKQGSRPNHKFQNLHNLVTPENKKTSQGLFYLSYGMDDGGKRRYFLPVGSKWSLSLVAKSINDSTVNAKVRKIAVDAEIVLEQAKCSLWLLCNYGGVGSKGRKGFGSIQVDDIHLSIPDCLQRASKFRALFGCNDKYNKEPESPAINDVYMISSKIQTNWKDVWFALDQLGFSIQSFAKKYSHDVSKKALGLPRKVGKPMRGRFVGPPTNRHASPAHFHLVRESSDERYSIQVIAFPSFNLPNFRESKSFLQAYISYLDKDIGERIQKYSSKGQYAEVFEGKSENSKLPEQKSVRPPLPSSGDRIKANIVHDPKGKGRLFAKCAMVEKPGIIMNAKEVDDQPTIGDEVDLIVATISVNGKDIQFRLP